MFLSVAEERTFGWKPMNCPGSMLIFRSRPRSYRELPLRLAEFAPLHRFEASGTLHGMTRVREFVQDDAHLFVTEEQVEHEIDVLLEWIQQAFTTFRLEWSYELSTRPTSFLGDPAVWDRAEATLEKVLKASGVAYKVSPGEGAFYGPKIDIHIRDSLGRPWQTGTIQLDYQLPLRFGLEYQGADGALHTPVVIHRTILGSWERFFGVVLEHCAGRLPPWLCPVQVRVLPVTDRHQAAADALVARAAQCGAPIGELGQPGDPVEARPRGRARAHPLRARRGRRRGGGRHGRRPDPRPEGPAFPADAGVHRRNASTRSGAGPTILGPRLTDRGRSAAAPRLTARGQGAWTRARQSRPGGPPGGGRASGRARSTGRSGGRRRGPFGSPAPRGNRLPSTLASRAEI